MKKSLYLYLIALLLASPLMASNYQGLSKSISPYSGGITFGPFFALNQELRDQAQSQLKLTFSNNVYFSEFASVFADVNYFLPDHNLGLDLGFDVYLIQGPIAPFMGFGIGAHYFDKENQKFSDDFGGSLTAHLGMAIDLTNSLRVRMRVPFHLVANKDLDMGVGIDIGLDFSSQWSHIKTINP